ncbi:integrase core domain-containing protein [Nocardioides rotundus]|uniref:integrase core domain-containing protein n=1 Tax=Nocardioides rotundus TaxID=1774216 RepID=UPI001CBAAA90|nr:integrase core domain-containing protein [Nocardioides rotundus]UAL28376.1 integrase core domain-containing protein [Nocardioides rotundus]
MAEALNSLYKAELVRGPRQRRKGMWAGIDDLEIATSDWVDWYNQRRLHGELGHVPPVEHEDAYWTGIAASKPADDAA